MVQCTECINTHLTLTESDTIDTHNHFNTLATG